LPKNLENIILIFLKNEAMGFLYILVLFVFSATEKYA
jgi:hypothetical protein